MPQYCISFDGGSGLHTILLAGISEKPHKVKKRTAEYRMPNVEGWNRFAHSFFKQIEYIPSTFDIHYSKFEIRFFKVSLTIRLDARGQAALI